MPDALAPASLDLSRLDDALFDHLYREQIEPCFQTNEAGRLTAIAAFKRYLLYSAGAALLLGAITALFAEEWQASLVVVFMVGVVGAAISYSPIARFGKQLKRQYCEAIAGAMGATFRVGGFDPPALERIKALRLLPSCARSKFEDLFAGSHKGARYELYEGHLEQRTTDSKGRTRYSTVFRGQLIRMHFPRDFLGVTIVRRDAGVFNMFGGGDVDGRKLERVRLASSEFEKAFEVWGSDQVEARYLLHPYMMQRLIELETGLHGKRLRCAFESGDLLVAVEGGNLFEPGDLFKPLVDRSRARRIIDEIAGVVRVMDQVLTAQAAR